MLMISIIKKQRTKDDGTEIVGKDIYNFLGCCFSIYTLLANMHLRCNRTYSLLHYHLDDFASSRLIQRWHHAFQFIFESNSVFVSGHTLL